MPNPWKKATMSGGISRLIASIRSKRGESSPLVVQTGFPTSLADIVVKNRSRLKKPKSARKHRQKRSQDFFGSRVSEVIEAVNLREETPRSCVDETEIVEADGADEAGDVARNGDDGKLEILGVGRGVDRVAEEKSNLCASFVVGEKKAVEKEEEGEGKEEEKAGVAVKTPAKSGWRNRKIGCQAKMILLMVPAFYSKKLVLAIMAFAIALLFLECATNRVSTFLKSRTIIGEKKSEKEAVELGSSCSFSSCHDCSLEIEEHSSREKPAFVGERNELCQETEPSATTPKAGIVHKEVKKKKHWKKHVANKLRRRETKDRKLNSDSGRLDVREERDGITMEGSVETEDGSKEEEEDDENSVNNVETIDTQNSNEAVDAVSDHSAKNKDEKKIMLSQRNLVMCIVVLSGLTGGRILALGLTVAWWYLARRWRIRIIDSQSE